MEGHFKGASLKLEERGSRGEKHLLLESGDVNVHGLREADLQIVRQLVLVVLRLLPRPVSLQEAQVVGSRPRASHRAIAVNDCIM